MQLSGLTTLKGVTVKAPSDNRALVAGTLKRMALLAKAGSTDPVIIAKARQIVAHVQGKDFRGEATAIQNFVRGSIRYTRDPYFSETLQTPSVTLEQGHGDCDDHAILVASLLSAIGAPARFRAMRIPQQGPALGHVLTETRYGRGWVPVETTEPWPFGMYPDNIDLRGSMLRHL